MTATLRTALRLWTGVAVIAVCGWTMWQGVAFVRFSLPSSASLAARHPRQAAAAWRDRAGLASLAVAEALRAPVDAGDLDKAHERETLLIDYLSARPASSQTWIALAASRYSVGEPTAAVVSAFRMSAMTGPNEEAAMTQRALFGLLQWDTLPNDIRTRAMSDLCGLAIVNIAQLRLVMSVKSDAVRAAIRDGLGANGCSDSFIRQIGL
ncbi:MAG: hypothetical protein GC182_12410 [Rhodopseudomonas sp.]|nr:hypothetical protein [Rhodopseudomonas sp.]